MACPHREAMDDIEPQAEVCQTCVKEGTDWVSLRVCQTCGVVGCCDSGPGHAREHWGETGHPIIKPLEGDWVWCYECDEYIE